LLLCPINAVKGASAASAKDVSAFLGEWGNRDVEGSSATTLIELSGVDADGRTVVEELDFWCPVPSKTSSPFVYQQ
jgi:hypothetical protein